MNQVKSVECVFSITSFTQVKSTGLFSLVSPFLLIGGVILL